MEGQTGGNSPEVCRPQVDCKGVIIDIIKIQLNNGGLGDHWEAGSETGEVMIRGWEVANVNAVVA